MAPSEDEKLKVVAMLVKLHSRDKYWKEKSLTDVY